MNKKNISSYSLLILIKDFQKNYKTIKTGYKVVILLNRQHNLIRKTSRLLVFMTVSLQLSPVY